MKKALLLSILSISLFQNTQGQDTSNGLNPVEVDFTNLIETSNDYQGFKVVDYNELINLKNRTSQYFATQNEEIISQQSTIHEQQDEIARLTQDLERSQRELEEVRADKDAITFLGMPFSKEGYMAFMWGLVLLLVLALLFFVYRYKQSNTLTVEARDNLWATEKEFEAYREKSLEKEQHLGRQLQDERNRNNQRP